MKYIKYRIQIDSFNGYEVLYKKWWMPFYVQAGGTNTFKTIDEAKHYLVKFKNRIVYEE